MHVASDYGSVAGEVAVCLRAVGIADRSDLVKLDVSGDRSLITTAPGRVVHSGRAWWSVVSEDHVFVLVDRTYAEQLKALLAHATLTDVTEQWCVHAVIGPRAEALMRAPALGLGADLPAPGEVVEVALAGAEVVLVRESAQEFLVSVAPADAVAVWRALHAAGAHLGAASVGREAHERFEIAAGIRRSRVDHSGW